MMMPNSNHFKKIKWGDAIIIVLGLVLLFFLFARYWHFEKATTLEIRQSQHVFAKMSLNQSRLISVAGPIGVTIVEIKSGRARIIHSPCPNQHCVHQGWLTRAGESSICLPNRVAIRLLGDEVHYDSLNY